MMDLASDLRIQCAECRKRLYVSKENYEPYIYSEEHHNMGLESIYCIEDTIVCPYCGTPIEYTIFGSEYPPGGYNNEWFNISGGAEAYGDFARFIFTYMTPDHWNNQLSAYGYEKVGFAQGLARMEELASQSAALHFQIYPKEERLASWDMYF